MFDSSPEKARENERPRLFDVTQRITLPTKEAWETLWSWSDNIWSTKCGARVRDDGTIVQRYGCRMNTVAKQGKVKAAEITPPDISAPKKRRMAHFTESVNCLACIDVEKSPSGEVRVIPNPRLEDATLNVHTGHTIDDNDRKKRCSGLKANAFVDINRDSRKT